MTDSKIVQLPAFTTALDSLTKAGVDYEVYDKTRVEPTDPRFQTLLHITLVTDDRRVSRQIQMQISPLIS